MEIDLEKRGKIKKFLVGGALIAGSTLFSKSALALATVDLPSEQNPAIDTSGFVPYIGATQNLNLGTNSFILNGNITIQKSTGNRSLIFNNSSNTQEFSIRELNNALRFNHITNGDILTLTSAGSINPVSVKTTSTSATSLWSSGGIYADANLGCGNLTAGARVVTLNSAYTSPSGELTSRSYLGALSGGINILPNANATVGEKVVIGYRGSTWLSALEIANTGIGYGELQLMKSGGIISTNATITSKKKIITNSESEINSEFTILEFGTDDNAVIDGSSWQMNIKYWGSFGIKFETANGTPLPINAQGGYFETIQITPTGSMYSGRYLFVVDGGLGFEREFSQTLYILTNNVRRWIFNSSGTLLPHQNNVYDFGQSTYRVKTIYTVNVDATGNINTTGKIQENGNSLLPAGTILPFAGASTPAGFLMCDGSAVSRTTYSALFSAIGTLWGSGNGSTTFNIPNLINKFIAGNDEDIGTSAGSNEITLTVNQIPAHTHNYNAFSSGSGGQSGTSVGTTSTASSSTGGGQPFDNRPAFANVNMIIKI